MPNREADSCPTGFPHFPAIPFISAIRRLFFCNFSAPFAWAFPFSLGTLGGCGTDDFRVGAAGEKLQRQQQYAVDRPAGNASDLVTVKIGTQSRCCPDSHQLYTV